MKKIRSTALQKQMARAAKTYMSKENVSIEKLFKILDGDESNDDTKVQQANSKAKATQKVKK